jgi:hypothetical protein
MDTAVKDMHYRRNVIGISAAEFLWGLGLPVVVESTFLQLFLKSLGASSLALGMIPFFFLTGISVFALFSSYLTEGLAFKRHAVVLLHAISGAALLIFGALLYRLGSPDSILLVFFSCYAVFSVCVGMTLPVWLNYLVSILSEGKSVSGLAWMMIAQNAAKLLSSVAILRIVEQYAFAREAAAIVFLGVGGLFCVGALFFYLTRESPPLFRTTSPDRQTFVTFLRQSLARVIQNRNFLVFLAGDMDFYIVVTVISFYAAYATEFGGIEPAVAAGLFVGLIYTGAIVVNIALGTLGWLSLKKKSLFSKTAAVIAIVTMTLWTTPAGFYLASLLLGAARGARMLVYAPAVKRLSGLEDATAYFAVAPVLTLPVAAGLPLIAGRFLDIYHGLGADAYRLVFAVAAVLAAGAFVCAIKVRFTRHPAPDSLDTAFPSAPRPG